MKRMSIDDATPEEWGTLTALNNLSIRKPKKVDPVEQPDHYNKGAIEAIEAIKASMPEHEFKGYLKGNALKYLWPSSLTIVKFAICGLDLGNLSISEP